MICPQGTKHVWPTCFYSIASCEAQWGGPNEIKAKCEATDDDISKVTHQEYTFPGENGGDDCKEFLDGFLSKTTVGASAQKDSEVAQAQCGCKELFGAALNQLIDIPTEATGDSFCDGLIKGFVEKKAKLVCGPLKGLGAALCDVIVDTTAFVAKPALGPVCGVLLEIGKAFEIDLEKIYNGIQKLAKETADEIADAFCGSLTCGSSDGTLPCKLITSTAGQALISVVSGEACNGESSGCFPAHAYVMLENGTKKKMMDVEIGDRVQVGFNRYSEVRNSTLRHPFAYFAHRIRSKVFMWTHRIPTIRVDFVKITHDHGTLLVSEDHYVYANHKMMTSRSVRVGDIIPLHDNKMLVVQNVSRENDVGLYNPQTRHGDIVVNGVVVTTYTNVVHPSVARGFISASKLLTAVGIDVLGTNVESANAVPWWAGSVVEWIGKGPDVA
ncbi:hypothetical protein HDU85_005883 [Gaertneriomyces sp. JEL0708]|nr:hypothetical protein HDU85_005883 [Gaertneriomyces sp. JEL0708]